MFTAHGSVKLDGNKFVGTFDIEGEPHHLVVAINTLNQEFKCSNATLTYSNLQNLIGPASWSGSIGKTNLLIKAGDSGSITGPLDARRLSTSRVSGAGIWTTVTASPNFSLPPSTLADESQFPAPVEDPAKGERERRLLESGVPIIAVFGQTGTGKSTFINLIASEKQKVGKGIQSCTSEISVLEAQIGEKPIVVIDTPGIDDTRRGVSETDILISIARRLETMGRDRIWVTGVLFLHRITDNKFSQTAGRISTMLKLLCGNAAMSHLMICTTMWDRMSQEEGDERFIQLCQTSVWKEMVANGASTGVISSTSPTAKADAEGIVNELIQDVESVELAIQDEMINQGKSVGETGAGQVLTQALQEAREQAEREMKELRESLREENAVAEAKLKEAIRAQESEVAKLRSLTEAQARVQQANAERLRQEQEKAKREMEELREQLRQEKQAMEQELMMVIRTQEAETRNLLNEQAWTRAQEEHAYQNRVVHPATCDLCDSRIIGVRWKCTVCDDWDVCSSCHPIAMQSHPPHQFLAVTQPTRFLIV